MMTVQNRIRMINLIEKIERNRKYADEMHVKNVSVLMKSINKAIKSNHFTVGTFEKTRGQEEE